jgi:hypothetical protein
VEDKQMALAIKQLAIWQFAEKEQNLTLINTDAADRKIHTKSSICPEAPFRVTIERFPLVKIAARGAVKNFMNVIPNSVNEDALSSASE